jgi:hypothetical protein
MLVVPALLLLGLRRADALKAAASGSGGAVDRGIADITSTPWRHTFTPGLMTGAGVTDRATSHCVACGEQLCEQAVHGVLLAV